jgi:hypothetical protein
MNENDVCIRKLYLHSSASIRPYILVIAIRCRVVSQQRTYCATVLR